MTAKMRKKDFLVTPDALHSIEYLSGIGLTVKQVGAFLGVSERYFRDRRAVDQELAAALFRGQSKAAGKVGEALYKKAVAGDVGAIKWYEMTRCGRSEKRTNEHTGKDGGNLNVTIKWE